jgi:hypothetical protein
LAALLLVATSLVATRASALDVLRLSWDAPADCPSAESVRAAAVRNAPPSAVPLEAAAVVVHRGRWTVTLRTSRPEASGERTLEAASCSALADATAVILALALVPPGDAAPDPEPTPVSVHVNEPRPTGSSAEQPAHRPLPQPRSPNVALAAFASTDATTLPSAALGGGASLAWTPSDLRIEATGTMWSGQSRTLDQSTAGARFTMTSLAADACYTLLHGSFELAPCAGASVQFVSAKGFGATANYDASARWPALDGGLLARAPISSWLALRARVDGLAPLSRPSFEVENEGVVHKPPPLGIRASLGAELNFL